MSLPTVTDLKIHLNKTDGDDDDELQSTLDRAAAILSRRIGPLELTTVTDEVHTGPGPLILRQYPVVAVSSASTSSVAVTDLDLDADAGVLHGTFGAMSRAVRVTYTAGRDELPEDLRLAVLELARHLWASQRGSSSSRPAFPGEDDVGLAAPTGGSHLLPYRVQSLIEPYLLPVIA